MRNHKLIWNIRCSDMDLNAYGFLYRWTVKAGALFSKMPEIVISNSMAGKKVHQTLGYHPKGWKIIPNGFDTKLFKLDLHARELLRSKLGIQEDTIVIGRVARYDPMKGYECFLNAAKIALDKYPDIHFIVAGKGVTLTNSEIREILNGIEKRENIHLLGELDDIHRVYPAMDIACSASYSGEGFPNTIAEAMAAGVPCVVTDVGDSAIIVNDTGIVIPKKNSMALARAWESLINAGPIAIKKMGLSARKRIESVYSLSDIVKAYETLYEALS